MDIPSDTIRIIVVGISFGGISTIKPLIELLKSDDLQNELTSKNLNHLKNFEIYVIDPRKGFINSYALPRSIIDPEFAAKTYCALDDLNLSNTKSDKDEINKSNNTDSDDYSFTLDDYENGNMDDDTINDDNDANTISNNKKPKKLNVSVRNITGWCSELYENHAVIRTLEEDYFKLPFNYCVYSAGKRKKYPFTPKAYTKNSFVEEMYKTTMEITKASKIVLYTSKGVLGVETAAMIKTRFPNKEVTLCYPGDKIPILDGIFKKLYSIQKELVKNTQDNTIKSSDSDPHPPHPHAPSPRISPNLNPSYPKTSENSLSTSQNNTKLNELNPPSKKRSFINRLRSLSRSSANSPMNNSQKDQLHRHSSSSSSTPPKKNSAPSSPTTQAANPQKTTKTTTTTSKNDSKPHVEPIPKFQDTIMQKLMELDIKLKPNVVPLKSIGFCEDHRTDLQHFAPSVFENSVEEKTKDNDNNNNNSENTTEPNSSTDPSDHLSKIPSDSISIIDRPIISQNPMRGLITEDGEYIPADALLWFTDDQPNNHPFKHTKLASSISPVTKEVIVDITSRVAPYPSIFAIGDVCNFDRVLFKNNVFDVSPTSMTLSGMLLHGRLVANNIVRSILNQNLLTVKDFSLLVKDEDLSNGLLYNRENSHRYSKDSELKLPVIPRFIVSLGLKNCVSVEASTGNVNENDEEDLKHALDFKTSMIKKFLGVGFELTYDDVKDFEFLTKFQDDYDNEQIAAQKKQVKEEQDAARLNEIDESPIHTDGDDDGYSVNDDDMEQVEIARRKYLEDSESYINEMKKNLGNLKLNS
ncbi:hypothetical protein BVG19_g3060 [[Candida] boidinii]|nr:hypothetical protein BVG19_g3060 [[Candida] boidinii]OWB53025.1 hypothetical protein B5S27_g4611 [[Candida] boidinii]